MSKLVGWNYFAAMEINELTFKAPHHADNGAVTVAHNHSRRTRRSPSNVIGSFKPRNALTWRTSFTLNSGRPWIAPGSRRTGGSSCFLNFRELLLRNPSHQADQMAACHAVPN